MCTCALYSIAMPHSVWIFTPRHNNFHVRCLYALRYVIYLMEKENLEIVFLKPGGKEQIRNSILKYYTLAKLERLGFHYQMEK